MKKWKSYIFISRKSKTKVPGISERKIRKFIEEIKQENLPELKNRLYIKDQESDS